MQSWPCLPHCRAPTARDEARLLKYTQPLSPMSPAILHFSPPLVLTEFCGDLGYRCKATVRRRTATGPADLDITTSTRLLLAKTPEVSEWISRLSLSLSLCLCLSRFSNWAAHCKHMLRFLQILTMKCPTSCLLMEPRDCFFVCFFLKLLRRVILLWLDKYFSKSVTLRL